MPRGFSLLELVVWLALAAVLLAAALPRVGRVRDSLAVHQASLELATFYQAARQAALTRATRVRVEFGADTLRAVLEGVVDSVYAVTPGPRRHRVVLVASRAVVRIDPGGMGYGAANTTLLLRRGAVAESLTTSRLGRLKRW